MGALPAGPVSSISRESTAMVTTTGSIPPPEIVASPAARASSPARQLGELPHDELEHLAEELGVDSSNCKTPQDLVTAVHERRQLIAAMDHEALLDVVRWGRRPVTLGATREQLAQEIIRIKTMRFDGLSERGLQVIARLRGIEVGASDDVPAILRKLRKQEGFFKRIGRKRRAWVGGLVARAMGEKSDGAEYRYLPPPPGDGASPVQLPPPLRSASIKDEIEESGLFGGLSNRIKKSADQYLNQKLDEIEARIDRKLDEIDRRLAEWRDKEIANRIRILKITLWASVIVGICSLIYSYVKVHLMGQP